VTNRLHKPQLDALRAFAVIAVLIHHFFPVQRFIPDQFLTLGLLGVRLFFVLSGYLITGILLEARARPFLQSLAQFYTRRTLRIFPIYYLLLLVCCMVGYQPIKSYISWHLCYLSNLLFILHPAAGRPYTQHLWSLSVEEQFYLVWPLLMLLAPRRWLLKLVSLVICGSIIWKTAIAFSVRYNTGLLGDWAVFACMDSLGLGAMLALFEWDEYLASWRHKLLRWSVGCGGVIVLLQAAQFISGQRTVFEATSYLGVSLVFVWLIGRAADGFGGKLGFLLETRPLLYIGKISYGIYLYHNFMPPIIRFLTTKAGSPVREGIMMATLSVVATFALASVSWKMIENPINQLKRKITDRPKTTTGLHLEKCVCTENGVQQ